jgi:hypothetical protein
VAEIITDFSLIANAEARCAGVKVARTLSGKFLSQFGFEVNGQTKKVVT